MKRRGSAGIGAKTSKTHIVVGCPQRGRTLFFLLAFLTGYHGDLLFYPILGGVYRYSLELTSKCMACPLGRPCSEYQTGGELDFHVASMESTCLNCMVFLYVFFPTQVHQIDGNLDPYSRTKIFAHPKVWENLGLLSNLVPETSVRVMSLYNYISTTPLHCLSRPWR